MHQDRIAIVGVGAVLPGAADLAEFWSNILAVRSASRNPPPGRWALDPADVYAPGGPRPDRVYSTRGFFLDDGQTSVERASAALPGFNSALSSRLDPLYRLLIIAGAAAWHDANTAPLDLARVGVIVGNIALPTTAASHLAEQLIVPHLESQLRRSGQAADRPNNKTDAARADLTAATSGRNIDPLNRYVTGLPAQLLAGALGLSGGAMALDAACASSLYAIKLAADELLAGRADAVLAGGVSRPDSLYTQMGFAQLGALSPSGRCAPFSAAADGLVVGEGAGVFVLKRLSDALAHGDRIYGLIAGCGLSNDTLGNLMSPDSSGQLRAMRAAYRAAGIAPSDIDLIECHGTGTPVGDAVEFRSLRALWENSARRTPCVIGSVKSNVGHLLTAAGAAGMAKVLLALNSGTLPPSANFDSPSRDVPLADSPFRILQEAESWPVRPDGQPRRAAISGFGFGGINAHVIVEEWRDEPAPSRTLVAGGFNTSKNAPPIAIVGLAAHAGPWRDLSAVAHRLFGDDATVPTTPPAWFGLPEAEQARGYFIDTLDVPQDRYRIPPTELGDMLPQQLLMLEVAQAAIDDMTLGGTGGLPTSADESPANLDLGVFIGIALDLNTTNFHVRWSLANHARRWAELLGKPDTGPEFDSWIAQLRDVVSPPLSANRTMGALGGIVASRVARLLRAGGPSFVIEAEENSGLRAIQTAARALQNGEIRVALTGAVDLAGDVRAALHRDANIARENPILGEGAAALVLKRLDDAIADGDQIYAVLRDDLNPQSSIPNPTPIHAAHSFGDCGAATSALSVMAAALALSEQVLPSRVAVAKRSAATAESRDDPTSTYWLHNRADGPRRAIVESRAVGGDCTSIVLEEYTQTQRTPSVIPATSTPSLFLIHGRDKTELLVRLEALDELARKHNAWSIVHLAARWQTEQKQPNRAALCVALTAQSTEELRPRVLAARRAIESAHRVHESGLHYSPRPLLAESGDKKLAFVYPGAGNQFPGMGRELAIRWPSIMRRLEDENERLADQFAAGRFWDDSFQGEYHQRDVAFGQVWIGALVTGLLAQFALRPQVALGYSLGESAALFATRAWTARDQMLRRMNASPLFSEELAGECRAARRAWNLQPHEQVDWQLGMIDRPADAVRAALVGRQRVYLLIVNTPNECVIGGQRLAVESVVRELGCNWHPIQGVTTVHCEVANSVADDYRRLHLLPTNPPADVTFYSGAWGRSYPITSDNAAQAITDQATATLDFPRLLNAAYDDDARIFVEIGPGQSCTRMIGQILADREHLVLPICVQGRSEQVMLIDVVAALATEGYPVDTSVLHEHLKDETAKLTSGNALRVPVGNAPIDLSHLIPTELPPASSKVEVAIARTPALARAESPWHINAADRHVRLVERIASTQRAKAAAQSQFLQVASRGIATAARARAWQARFVGDRPDRPRDDESNDDPPALRYAQPQLPQPFLSRDACLEFAIGSIASVLGPDFAEIDEYPTRVRLPAEPLMLVDRILSVEGVPRSLGAGRVITEHDVLPGAWYLDGGRIPTCIAVEAGQADLFLSGYLGIDFRTRGQAVYRLLDAVVTFHRELPRPGEVIHYNIRIERFFRQGETHLFRFRFDATVDGEPLLTMREGCAGFFSPEELAAGQGVIQTTLDRRPAAGVRPADWRELAPMCNESYDDLQIAALRGGDLATCFGDAFAELAISRPATIPGGRMTLIHRVTRLDPAGGRYGLGQITAEADIAPDDWYLTCHFIDDQVMPGTLMYECCLHTLRVFLLRMGWVAESDQVAYEPVPGISSQLKCRGQVTAETSRVQYEITLKELGYEEGSETPYAIADALMYADGKPIVQMNNMSLRISGAKRGEIEALWRKKAPSPKPRAPLFPSSRILAFATGNPSEAFGEPYRIFDRERVIARLPGPPYQFLDRIVAIENCQPFVLAAGGRIEAEYDVPPDAWYFAANRQREMPYAALLEIALQPCGWLAAYLGSALTSDIDLSFRNLGGQATLQRVATAQSGTLTTTVKITNVSQSAGMIIQNFDFAVRDRHGVLFSGDTYFGFFSKAALSDQVGIRDAKPYEPTPSELAQAASFTIPTESPFPDARMRMIDQITYFPTGGPAGLGYLRGTTPVDPAAWFFKAHFHQDPVWPGSLGLESFIQLLKVAAIKRWHPQMSAPARDDGIQFESLVGEKHRAGVVARSPDRATARTEGLLVGEKHRWVYRGQILPTDSQVTVQAVISAVNDAERTLQADGCLWVDGRLIYQMNQFTLRMPSQPEA